MSSFRSRIMLLVALLAPQVAAYQIPLATKGPALGLRNSFSTHLTPTSKLRTASRPLSSRLFAQVATRPRDEFIDTTESGHTLERLQHVLKGTEISLEEVLLGVEVGEGIRCHSLPASLQETTNQDQRALQRVVSKLHEAAIFSADRPNEEYQLDFTVGEVVSAREEIVEEYHLGERRMTQLAQLLSNRFAEGDYECISTVEAQSKGGKFTLSEAVSHSELKGGADSLGLASKQLRNLNVAHTEGGEDVWEQPRMVDHSIEFESMVSNEACVHRVKAHACDYKELWKIMSDSIFDIDHPDVRADFAVESVFRIRITAEDEEAADNVEKKLAQIVFSDQELREHGVSVSQATRAMQLVSKWGDDRAMEMIWGGTKVGIEVVTLEEDYRRREVSFKSLAAERKERREQARASLEEQSMAYGFSRRMLSWIFSERLDTLSPPSLQNLKVRVHL